MKKCTPKVTELTSGRSGTQAQGQGHLHRMMEAGAKGDELFSQGDWRFLNGRAGPSSHILRQGTQPPRHKEASFTRIWVTKSGFFAN